MKLASLVLALAAATGAMHAHADPAASEAEATALLLVVNGHEILAADLAASKGVSAPVADYAQMLRSEHAANQDATMALPEAEAASKIDSPPVLDLQDKGAAQRSKLSQLSGQVFEDGYVDAMVVNHTETLTLIDDKLLPAAVSPEAKAHFVSTREHIAKHLEQAKALQAK